MARIKDIRAKRAYDDADQGDGVRVLVDRLWPRGLKKDDARLDEWCKEIAPSQELRKWYGHEPERYDEFVKKYADELQDKEHREALEHLRQIGDGKVVTLLSATKDLELSQVPTIVAALRE
ncbi:DUF488 domain-containing protein [Leekyejoonella antrihumi]|uniref:DUF488 family protein n=1 Tax=Leekyejoonella antrihumi TaxID=1660198 RepID=A0A563DTP1_9MICO|nr:DUF488 family protein [Leekyejoonella antrihumi]TWP33615.1 DUF488 family protein [Leekyejoonella antrihumi]